MNLKNIYLSLISLLCVGILVFSIPTSAHAENSNNNNNNQHNNNNNQNNNNDQNFCKKHPQDNKCKKDDGKDKNDCKKHPEKRECHVSVPEFGAIPGVIAAVTSAGSFYILKRKNK